MQQKINKSYSFYSNDLNKVKYDLLYDKALKIRDYKNEISEFVCKNPIKFFNLSKFDWINTFRRRMDNCNNQDISNAISDTYVAYENKITTFNRKIKSKVQSGFKKTLYKKNGKHYKKDDIKSFEPIFKETKLTKVVSYLAKFYSDEFIEFLKENKNDNRLRIDALYYVEKYGDRLIDLILLKQKNTTDKITKHPIKFVSLTFTSCTEQKENIINPNKNKQSIFNCVISLSGQNREKGKLYIPIKYSRKHHGNLKDYYKTFNSKGQRVISYKISFYKKRIRIILTRLGIDETVKNKSNYYGVDVNVKHNLFSDKYGNFIDYDRDIFNDYISFLKRMDEKKKRKDSNILSKKDNIKFNNFKVIIKDMLKRKCNALVKQAISLNKNHIVMEDLQHMAKSFARNNEFEGFKYSRLIRLLNLADLKNIVKSIANKHNIQVTFVQPHYTSKACDQCGHIHDDNRKTQENFECVSCGNKANADTHSAKMIEDRLHLDVLRKSLLVLKDGLYSPNKLKKEAIKNILVECYDINS
jgi:IS605 OrfB family transposase